MITELSKVGEVSKNTIYNMDCLIGMKMIPDNSIDCVITDPPYWTTACKWDSIIPFELMWKELKRIIKPNGAIVLFGSEPFSSALRMSNIKMYKYDWIWEKSIKTNFLNAKRQPLRKTENISIFSLWKEIYNPQWLTDKNSFTRQWKTETNNYGKQDRSEWYFQQKTCYPDNILKFTSNDLRKSIHPTQKPVALIEYLIRTYTNEWETVLDFTIGSGTTAIACINTNRNYIGFELDKWYFDIANERIAWKLQNKE